MGVKPMKIIKWLYGIGLLAGLMAWCVAGGTVWAENIDPLDYDEQYAWGENIGWLNVEPLGQDGPGLSVAGAAITGYVWAENIGWISFSCENTGSCDDVTFSVVNDGSGNLSGYAWSENAGWISFSCENTASCETVDYGVVVDTATGQFCGQAWGENIGWIAFDSTLLFDAGIVTAWNGAGCLADIEPDGDVDGVDLADYAGRYGSAGAIELITFAGEFGSVCIP
jgi:hypothetical protein